MGSHKKRKAKQEATWEKFWGLLQEPELTRCKLEADRVHILENYSDRIRRSASEHPMKTVVIACVDLEETTYDALGSAEAAEHYVAWCRARDDHAVQITACPLKDAIEFSRGSDCPSEVAKELQTFIARSGPDGIQGHVPCLIAK